jgi:uncharacterized protein (DUF1810 family)
MLDRFVTAQAPLFDAVCAELAAGRKRSHWMWFVFPQLRALGRSATARRFGLADLQEARAYWAHPVLGPRLAQAVDLVLAVHGKTASEILGSPDDLKLRSCMTLFELAAPGERRFGQVIDRLYGGMRDERTLALLGEDGPGASPQPSTRSE